MKIVGKRHRSREIAVQMLYQHDLGGSRLEEIFHGFEGTNLARESDEEDRRSGAGVTEAIDYARTLVEGAVQHRGRVDELIEEGATNWRIVRMSAVDRSILRLAVYELLFESDVPQVVILDEAIELAKRFGSEQSAAFVNGVLDGLLRRADLPGSLN